MSRNAVKRPAGRGAPAPLRLTPALRGRVKNFAGLRVAVWGDMILDRFLYGTISRLSREAPVPIIEKSGVHEVPGGGGNALMNLAALGARVDAYGLLGGDGAGDSLRRLFRDAGVADANLLRAAGYQTATKTRILAAALNAPRQQLARLDEGGHYRGPLAQRLGAALRRSAKKYRAVVISDYGYGAVDAHSFSAAPWPVLTAIDSRYDFLRFAGAATATPNETELFESLDLRLREGESADDAIAGAARRFQAATGLQALLVTRGGKGSALFVGGVRHDTGVYGGEVADVTGAGDTVIAAFTLARAAGAPWREAQLLAAVAAGLKVAKRGTATVSAKELLAVL
jgi:rfaE bifunctional protein kinase chain/domain